MKNTDLNYRFHSVGQGLFCSGSIESHFRPSFTWVYDCGTQHSTNDNRVEDEVDSLIQSSVVGNRPKLDLLVISHFVRDHISGIAYLLSKVVVDTVLIPYVLPWQRLVLILSDDYIVDDISRDFIADPVQALLDIPGAQIGRIIQMRSAVGSDPDADDLLDPTIAPKDSGDSDGINERAVIIGNVVTDPLVYRNNRSTSVLLMSAGSRMIIDSIEFIPYNDVWLKIKPTPELQKSAEELLQKLPRKAHKITEARKIIRALKKEYEAEIRSPYGRNAISLFMYVGVKRTRVGLCFVESLSEDALSDWSRSSGYIPKRAGMLYTGDGSLRSAARWKRLKAFLVDRVDEGLFGVQVMHHGSGRDSHLGLAAAMQPSFAFFSYGRGNAYGHPSGAVVLDFSSAGVCVAVNEKRSANAWLSLH